MDNIIAFQICIQTTLFAIFVYYYWINTVHFQQLRKWNKRFTLGLCSILVGTIGIELCNKNLNNFLYKFKKYINDEIKNEFNYNKEINKSDDVNNLLSRISKIEKELKNNDKNQDVNTDKYKDKYTNTDMYSVS